MLHTLPQPQSAHRFQHPRARSLHRSIRIHRREASKQIADVLQREHAGEVQRSEGGAKQSVLRRQRAAVHRKQPREERSRAILRREIDELRQKRDESIGEGARLGDSIEFQPAFAVLRVGMSGHFLRGASNHRVELRVRRQQRQQMPRGGFGDRQLRSHRRFDQPRQQRDGRGIAESVAKQRANQPRVELGLLAEHLLQRGFVRVARLQNQQNALGRGDWLVGRGLRGGFSDGLERAEQDDGDGAVRVGGEGGGGEESAEAVGLEDGGVERLLAERGNVELSEDGVEGRELREAMKKAELGRRDVGEGEGVEKVLEEGRGLESGQGGSQRGRASEADLHEGCELGEERGVEGRLREGG